MRFDATDEALVEDTSTDLWSKARNELTSLGYVGWLKGFVVVSHSFAPSVCHVK